MDPALINAFALHHVEFEHRVLLVVFMLVGALVLFPLTLRYWHRIYLKYVRKHPDVAYVFKGHESVKHVFHDVSFIMKLLLILYAGFIGWSLVHEQPVIAAVSPEAYSKLTDASPTFRITFSVPVDKDNITFHLSPIIEGEWFWEKPSIEGLYRTARFLPAESFLPDNRVVLYMVGVRSITQKDKSHEMAIEFTGPRTPRLTEVYPQNGQIEVSIATSLLLTYDEPVGDFVDTQIVIHPDPGTFSVENQGMNQMVLFEDALKQDQSYSVQVFQTIRSYDTKTKEDRIRGETQKITAFSFNTVSTPLIDSHEPKGNAVLPDAPLRVTFDQEMDQQSVSDHFVMTPETEGESRWEDEKTMVFIPESGWQRGTSYTVRFDSGMQSKNGGAIADTIELTFATIGAVKVTDISPLNGASGVDPLTSNISITFDQPVNQQSAEAAVTVTPTVNYDAAWLGNTLTLQSAGNLGHMTKYTVTISAGIASVFGLESTQNYSSSFTTKQKSLSLGVPYHGQEETFTCNIAAARMALAYRGVYLSENAVQDGVGYSDNPNAGWVDGYGVHIGPIANYIDNHRNVAIKQGWNIQELLIEVQKGNPVIIWEYNRYSQPYGAFTLPSGATGYMGMHSEVVRGFIGDSTNPTHILTNDPWRGQLTYTIDTFMSVWGYLNNTALVVY